MNMELCFRRRDDQRKRKRINIAVECDEPLQFLSSISNCNFLNVMRNSIVVSACDLVSIFAVVLVVAIYLQQQQPLLFWFGSTSTVTAAAFHHPVTGVTAFSFQHPLHHRRTTSFQSSLQILQIWDTTATIAGIHKCCSKTVLSVSSSSLDDEASSSSLLPQSSSEVHPSDTSYTRVIPTTSSSSSSSSSSSTTTSPPKQRTIAQPQKNANGKNNNSNYRNHNNNSYNNNNKISNNRYSNDIDRGNNNRGNNSIYKKKTYNGNNNNNNNSNSNNFDNKDKQLNQLLVRAETAKDLLLLLQQHTRLQSYKAGDTLNNVNHSTSLHRLAKHAVTSSPSTTTNTNGSTGSTSNYKQNRAMILSDPRFALLVTSIAENIATTATSTQQIQEQKSFFQTRELSNIGWALSKLKLPPPLSAIPSIYHNRIPMENELKADRDQYLDTLLHVSCEQLSITAMAVREAVIRVAAERARGVDGIGAESWIQLLSQLAGEILDTIGVIAMVLDHLSQQKSTTPSPITTKPKTFQMQEWSNLLWAWATAGRADHHVFGLVVRNMIEQQKQKSIHLHSSINGISFLQPQEWTNSIWAFATAQCYQSHIELIEYVSELLDTYPEFINDFKSQELSNTIWGVATLLSNKKLQPQYSNTESTAPIVSTREQRAALTILRRVIKSVIRRNAEGFRTQELSNTAWATATLGFGINQGQETSLLNNYLVIQSDEPKEDTKLMVDMIYAIADSAMKQLPRFWSQELNNLAWALARLLGDNNNLPSFSTTEFETRIAALLRGIASQLADPRRSVNSQDIGTTLWSLATLEFCDKELYRNIAVRLTPDQAHRSKPQELSNTIWAFATSEMEISDMDAFDTTLVPSSQRKNPPADPITACFGVAADELMRRPYSFKPQEIKDVLWSFSKVGLRHPELFKFVAEHLVGSENESSDPRGLDDFSTQGIGNMAWAFARQAQLSEVVSDRLNLNAGNGRMSTYKTIYFDVGENLLLKFFSSIAETNIRVYDKLGKGKPQDISNTVWAFASLGLKDERYMNAAKDALIDRLTRYAQGERSVITTFKGQELANLLWAMATLNVSIGNVWSAVMLFLSTTCADNSGSFTATSISRYFKRQELASMAWACSVFGNYPEELMQFLYIGLFGVKGKEQDPKRMESIYNDSGLQMQAIMTLIYVQTEIDKRGICQNLSLPDNFPDGWKETAGATDSREDHITELSLELNLSTSKIQRAVSAAFLRIGFDHEEEHTITMQEMAESHGIRIPSKNIEVLSIDIANEQQKIGIEVDGPSHFVTRTDDYWEGTGSSGGYSKLINGKLEYQFGWTGERQEMNGPTVLKDRLLSSFGWKILHLPFWEWYALGGDSVAEEKYCRLLLDKVT